MPRDHFGNLLPFQIKRFKGLNNVQDAVRLDSEDLDKAENVDIDDMGTVLRRKGYTKIYNGSGTRNLFSYDGLDFALFTEGGSLKKIDQNNTINALQTGLTTTGDVSYSKVGYDIYYNDPTTSRNGIVTAAGVHKTWGTGRPSGQPLLSSATGSLTAGRYLIAITHVFDDGRESSTGKAALITLSAAGGITLSSIPQGDATVDYVRIYISPPDGEMLYLVAQIAAGVTTTTIASMPSLTTPLRTQFLLGPPDADLMAHESGRIYVASGKWLFWSKPFTYHLFDQNSDYVGFPDKITMLGATRDGLFVCADKTYWFPLPDLVEVPQAVPLTDDVSIQGEAVEIDGKDIGEGLEGRHLLWLGQNGLYLGSPGGKLRNLTNRRIAFVPDGQGMALWREDNGMSQILALFKSGGDGNVRTSDFATAEVIRGGVVIS